jgi:hypothetical protein
MRWLLTLLLLTACDDLNKPMRPLSPGSSSSSSSSSGSAGAADAGATTTEDGAAPSPAPTITAQPGDIHI